MSDHIPEISDPNVFAQMMRRMLGEPEPDRDVQVAEREAPPACYGVETTRTGMLYHRPGCEHTVRSRVVLRPVPDDWPRR